ncbi:hypothetical protein LXL04_034125 [Taraxacum kok-saghyz]
MTSTEWIPLVLRVLEFGDQTQQLFSVRCSPQIAAYYFLDLLLTGFDEDRNLENGRQVIAIGGLSLLLRRIATGDDVEKGKAVSVIYCCIQSDGRCRHYLADNLNPELILALLVHDANETVFSLLIELICLHRFEQRTKLFNKLLKGWDCLNTLQILLVSLQWATQEKRPLIATIMLQLDLMADPLKSSVYREEAIEAITAALDCQICNENVQEETAKALLILGGRYSYTGTPEAKKWILKEAGYDESLEGGFHGRYFIVQGSKHLNDDDEIEHWQRKAAMALWISGGEKLLRAFGESISNEIPCLARAISNGIRSFLYQHYFILIDMICEKYLIWGRLGSFCCSKLAGLKMHTKCLMKCLKELFIIIDQTFTKNDKRKLVELGQGRLWNNTEYGHRISVG